MNAAVKNLTSPHVCKYVSVDRSTDVRVYAPPPGDKLRCNTFNAFDDYSGENITQDLRQDNVQNKPTQLVAEEWARPDTSRSRVPTPPIILARRR